MAPSGRSGGRKRRPPILDEFGGTSDGGLAILDGSGHMIHMTPSRVAGALRYFTARVQLHDAQGLPERLALTSALIGEGVTYITRSLAAVIAYDTDASVVVVDLTFRRPMPTGGARNGTKRRRSKGEAPRTPAAPEAPAATPPAPNAVDGSGAPAAGAPNVDQPEPGPEQETQARPRLSLADAIERDASVDDIIVPTANPRLCMIAAGEVPVARRPALAQGRPLAAVLDQLDERFDHVLLDIPPVLLSSDAMNLSQLADAYVLVVRQGATSESQVEAALAELQGGETLGVILNRFDSDIPKRLRRLVGT